MAALHSLAKYIEGSGLDTVAIETSIYSPAPTVQMLAKNLTSAMKLMTLIKIETIKKPCSQISKPNFTNLKEENAFDI